MKVSIVIPNYNGESLLKKNLPVVIAACDFYAKKTNEIVEIIVIDDASTDASASVISNFKFQISNFKFIRSEKNLGFSSTVNQGVLQAKGEILVLLNTDVAPSEDFLAPLVKHFEEEAVFAVGAMDKSIENGKEVLRGRGIGKWQRGFLVHAAGSLDKDTSLWASGGSSAFRKTIWEKLGGLDALFDPFYWEDIDIAYRALKSGYKIYFEKKSIVVHEHEKGAIKTKYSKNAVQKIAYRNQFIFVWKNADSFVLIEHLVWLPYHFIKAILRFDMNFFSGFLGAVCLFPKILSSRRENKKQFIFTDYDIMAENTR